MCPEGQTTRQLRARNVGRGRTLLTFSDLESDHIANFEFIVSHTDEILRVEEQILHFAFASDESESSVRKGFDSSGHSDCMW